MNKELEKINKLAKSKNINATIHYSTSKNKRFMAVYPDNKKIHFGQPGAITYFDKKDEKKRAAYIARHSKIYRKDGTRAIDDKRSAAYLSLVLLW